MISSKLKSKPFSNKDRAPSSLFSLFQEPKNCFLLLGFSLLFFDLQYLMMSELPGSRQEMCVMGAGLTPANLIFAGVVSLLAGVFATGLLKNLTQKLRLRRILPSSGLALTLGSMTLFCPLCTLPAFSLVGLGVGLQFFAEYELHIKILSLVLLGYGLFDLDRQLRGICERCID